MSKNKFICKSVLALLIVVLFFLGFFERSINLQDNQSRLNKEFRKVENKAFGVGETLEFDISYGIIHAGTAKLLIPEYKTESNRKCFYIRAEAYSAAAFAWFFKVEDRYETYIDVEGIFPWRFEQHIREGKFKADNIAKFDHYKNLAITKDSSYKIPDYTHDILSAFYYVRTQNLSNVKAGHILKLENFYKNKVYPLDVKFLGRQTIKVGAGTFNCVIVEPLVQEGGLFKHKGRLLVWLSDDERKIPIKMTSEVIIGSISVELQKYSGLYGPLDSKK